MAIVMNPRISKRHIVSKDRELKQCSQDILTLWAANDEPGIHITVKVSSVLEVLNIGLAFEIVSKYVS